MQTLYAPPVPEGSPLTILFDKAATEAHLKAYTNLLGESVADAALSVTGKETASGRATNAVVYGDC